MMAFIPYYTRWTWERSIRSESYVQDLGGDGTPWDLRRYRSRELIGSQLYSGCACPKRNGLQDECRRLDCKGRDCCRAQPVAKCRPSGGPGTCDLPAQRMHKNNCWYFLGMKLPIVFSYLLARNKWNQFPVILSAFVCGGSDRCDTCRPPCCPSGRMVPLTPKPDLGCPQCLCLQSVQCGSSCTHYCDKHMLGTAVKPCPPILY